MFRRSSVPNLITIGRALSIPLLAYLMVDLPGWGQIPVALLFIVASLSDVLDGYLSRRWKVESDFGRLLDPLADKLLVMTALVMLVGQRDILTGEPWVPAWIVVLILAREFWITGIRSFAHRSEAMVVAASGVGKAKSFLQMSGISLLMLHGKTIELGGALVPVEFFGLNLIFLSILLSYWSAVSYTAKVFCAAK
jgi:CDP-diacylglycerol--glycerol-3-phosphate 3-phosphatidyltransferase